MWNRESHHSWGEKQQAYKDPGQGQGSRDRGEEETERTREEHPLATYTVLGLSHGASQDEVVAAYQKLARQYHPDKVSHLGEEFVNMAHEKFRKIQEAYETLTGCSV